MGKGGLRPKTRGVRSGEINCPKQDEAPYGVVRARGAG
jgi:hypothetical protein